MRVVVAPGDVFACPICGARYVLELEEDGLVVVAVPSWAGGDRFCRHLDPEILPVAGDVRCRQKWEVYFHDADNEPPDCYCGGNGCYRCGRKGAFDRWCDPSLFKR